jgi:hypothetical protein
MILDWNNIGLQCHWVGLTNNQQQVVKLSNNGESRSAGALLG